MKGKTVNAFLLLLIIVLTFSVFFADGYLQWINSDTAAEAYLLDQNISFPQGLFSERSYHSRIFATIISYVSFNIIGSIYREIFNSPVDSLYFSQGIMSGSVYVFLALISAAYVSSTSGILSRRYLISAALVVLFAMGLAPHYDFREPFGLSVRFSHQAVMTNYVGTMVVALAALFPYWRYYCTNNWNDLYNNIYLRTIMYFLLFAAVFSSTATTIWLVIFSGLMFFLFLFCDLNKINDKNLKNLWDHFKKNTKCHPLIFLFVFGVLAILSETTTPNAHSAIEKFNLGEYLNKYCDYFVSSNIIPYISIIFIFLASIFFVDYKKGSLSYLQLKLWKIFVFILVFSFVYSIVIGIPPVSYRFDGTNLGRDTLFPAVWVIFLAIFAILICYWSKKKLIWLAPLLLFILFTNALNFFSFPFYAYKIEQKRIFEEIYQWNLVQIPEQTLPLHWGYIGFSKRECEMYTIPMLRNAGIISPQRKVVIIQ